MSLHTAFRFPDGREVVNLERGRYEAPPPGFFGTEEPRVVLLQKQVPGAAVPAWMFPPSNALVELVAWGLPGVWIRTHPSVATTACPACHSMPGCPCTFKGNPCASSHWIRGQAAKAKRWHR